LRMKFHFLLPRPQKNETKNGKNGVKCPKSTINDNIRILA
jgi:hypothetical protein